jgi:hypothetical protein
LPITKLSVAVRDCVMEMSNERCLRGAGDDREEAAAKGECGVQGTEAGVAEVGVCGAGSSSEAAAAAAAAAEMDAAGTSERLCVSMLYT